MKPYAKILLLLAIPLVLVLAYGLTDKELPSEAFSLTKVDLSSVQKWWDDVTGVTEKMEKAERARQDSLRADSIQEAKKKKKNSIDTTHHRILFFGDSMINRLSYRLSDYAQENGDSLMSVCWYSSTTELWSKTDTLQHFMKQFRPTFVIISLGGNEQFVRDLPKREKYIEGIMQKIGKLPYVWIGTPTWRKDTGINDIIINKVGKKRYFDSRNMELQRGKDRIHPTTEAAEQWMDSIANWLQSKETMHPIRMRRPQVERERVWKRIELLPYELKKSQ